MNEEQIKPLSVKLTVRVNINNYKAALARNYNVKPEEVEVIIEDEEEPREPIERKEPTDGDIIGDLSKPKEQKPFLMKFLKERGFNVVEAAQLCNVGKSTIGRARYGYRLRKESFQLIVKGLEMTTEEAKEFKKSLRRKQADYHGKERRKLK